MQRCVVDDVKRVVREHWGRRAAGFDAGKTHGILSAAQLDASRDLLRRVLGESPKEVLDAGCGTGFLALLAAELGHHARGVDLAPEMVALAREKAARAGVAATFVEGDVEHLEFTAIFDVVIARHLLWTLPSPVDALREWRRVLRPGGELVLIEGHWGERAAKDEYEAIKGALPLYGGRPAAEIAAAVRAAGFADVRVEPLMEGVLWGGEAGCERYLVRGWR